MITENRKITFKYGDVSYGHRGDFYELRLYVEARPTYMKDALSGSSHAPEVVKPNVIYLQLAVQLWDKERGEVFLKMRLQDISAEIAHKIGNSARFDICEKLADWYLDGCCTNREVRLKEEHIKTLEMILDNGYNT